MKKITLFLLLFLNLPLAKAASLVCTSGKPYETFSAKLNYNDFVSGSGLFTIEKASLRDHYATANLVCAGNRMEDLGCVGFWFNHRESMVEVEFTNNHGVFSASFKPLRGMDLASGPWPCTIK
ncbi:MAG: hypothetical protein IPK04_21930 [Bdellovibrionales bacterium]|nr:hypothetical protein [Bdellovibrionales bacterium]